jgi:DNA helicase II / ATP-dependent DNA helicase PcrA
MELTPQQKQVATCLDPTVLVLAAVGSGKTTTLSERVAHAVEHGVEPARILALTFTNRAAQRMRESLEARDAVAARRVHVHTFHGLCTWILRTEARSLGLSPSLWVHDEEDAEELIRTLGVQRSRQAMFRLHQEMSEEAVGGAGLQRYHRADFSQEPWAKRYMAALTERGGVDFAGLVYLARAALTEDPATANRWASKFDMVQVDEVQDTHLSEYDVIRHVASKSKSMCLVGDLDQTIYGWRGSAPRSLIKRIETDRGSATRILMTDNFRSTKALLQAANTVAAGLAHRATEVRAFEGLAQGTPPEIGIFPSPHDEAIGIARRCSEMIQDGVSPRTMAVLCRANKSAEIIGKALAAHQVSHATISTFRYFRRMEVKDALALLKLVVDRNSPAAAQRIALKLVRGVGKTTIARIRADGDAAGMRLTDLLDPSLVEHGDPLWGLACEEYVVLDTETTGIDPQHDEIIEVAAVRVRCGEMIDSYQALLRPSKIVGDSESVHGLSDAMLADEGRDPATVLKEFRSFIGDSPVAGHNVRFDLRMLAAHGEKVGVEMRFDASFDSLNYARRLLRCDSYRLGDLATELKLPVDPTHRALDDVHTTVHLLFHLVAEAHSGATIRAQLMKQHAPAFERLRESLDRWAALDERPGVLVHRILHEGRLLAYYSKHIDKQRLSNLEELSHRIARLDDPQLDTIEATRRALDGASLAREQDLLDEMDGVRVITIHQSKGLEFDHVFVPGMVDGRFPMWSAIENNDTEEDRRVFYVAVTRARKTLMITAYERDERGPCNPSRFLRGLA